jgi:hypothetical protein
MRCTCYRRVATTCYHYPGDTLLRDKKHSVFYCVAYRFTEKGRNEKSDDDRLYVEIILESTNKHYIRSFFDTITHESEHRHRLHLNYPYAHRPITISLLLLGSVKL